MPVNANAKKPSEKSLYISELSLRTAEELVFAVKAAANIAWVMGQSKESFLALIQADAKAFTEAAYAEMDKVAAARPARQAELAKIRADFAPALAVAEAEVMPKALTDTPAPNVPPCTGKCC